MNCTLLPSRLAPALLALLLGACQALSPTAADAPADSPPPAAAQRVATLDQLSEPCLKELYLRCSQAASAGSLSLGNVAGCSVVYETLLQRSFGGDFHALHAWSRQYPDDGSVALPPDERCERAGPLH